MNKGIFQGIVYKTTGSWYKVKTSQNEFVECKLKGNLKIKGFRATNPVVVGDIVEIHIPEDSNNGIITKLFPRKNYLIRKATRLSKESHIIAANIDMLFLVVSICEPETPLGFVDRVLVAAGGYHIPVSIIINKIDLYKKNPELKKITQNFINIYEPLGYKCIEVSAKTKKNIKELIKEAENKIVLFTGQSGVGKSALINAIEPSLNLKIGEISKYNFKGKHTTTFAEIFEISNNIKLIDTPGIKEFGIIDFKPEEVSHYFPEMLNLLHECKFNNCIHINEPDCAVIKAYEEGKIQYSRYFNYLSIIDNLKEEISYSD